MKTLILCDCNWNVHGRAQHFDAGKVYDLDAETAAELVAADMAEPVEDDPIDEAPARKGKVKHGDR